MTTLFLFADLHSSGYSWEYLDLASVVAILSGIFVIISKNPVISVLFLICLFLCISSYLLLIGINFIGLSYILVYIGAVSILFLFILMLINVRISELHAETSNSIPLSLLLGISLFSILNEISPFVSTKITGENLVVNILNFYTTNPKIVYVTSKLWDGYLAETSHISSIGNIMYTNYFLWLILTSVILLLAMVGTIVITLKPTINN